MLSHVIDAPVSGCDEVVLSLNQASQTTALLFDPSIVNEQDPFVTMLQAHQTAFQSQLNALEKKYRDLQVDVEEKTKLQEMLVARTQEAERFSAENSRLAAMQLHLTHYTASLATAEQAARQDNQQLQGRLILDKQKSFNQGVLLGAGATSSALAGAALVAGKWGVIAAIGNTPMTMAVLTAGAVIWGAPRMKTFITSFGRQPIQATPAEVEGIVSLDVTVAYKSPMTTARLVAQGIANTRQLQKMVVTLPIPTISMTAAFEQPTLSIRSAESVSSANYLRPRA